MKVNISIERSLVVPVSLKMAAPLLQDLEVTMGRFPKLKKLSRIGESCYLWEMQKIGLKSANISHEVIYAARYTTDLKKGETTWVGLPEHGNATIAGRLGVAAEGEHTRIEFKVHGELRDVPIPLLYRPVAPAFIQGQFSALVETFLERTGEAIAGAKVKPASGKQVPQ